MNWSVRLVPAGLLLVFGLGCGGVWSQATNQAAAQKFVELQGELALVDASPQRDSVDQMLGEAVVEAADGTYGITEIATIELQVRQVIEDGSISEEEVLLVAQVLVEAREH